MLNNPWAQQPQNPMTPYQPQTNQTFPFMGQQSAKPAFLQNRAPGRNQMMADALRGHGGNPQINQPPPSMGQFRSMIAGQQGYPTPSAMLHAQPEYRPLLRGEFSKSINPAQTHTLESLMAQYRGQ